MSRSKQGRGGDHDIVPDFRVGGVTKTAPLGDGTTRFYVIDKLVSNSVILKGIESNLSPRVAAFVSLPLNSGVGFGLTPPSLNDSHQKKANRSTIL